MSAVRFRPRPPVKSLTGIENPAIFLVAGFFVALADVTADVRGFRKSAGFLTVLALVVVVDAMPRGLAMASPIATPSARSTQRQPVLMRPHGAKTGGGGRWRWQCPELDCAGMGVLSPWGSAAHGSGWSVLGGGTTTTGFGGGAAGVALAQELRSADGLSSEGISPKGVAFRDPLLLPAHFRLQGTRPIVGWSWGGLCAQWLSGGRSLSTQTFRPLHRIQRLPNFLAARFRC